MHIYRCSTTFHYTIGKGYLNHADILSHCKTFIYTFKSSTSKRYFKCFNTLTILLMKSENSNGEKRSL